MRTNFYINDKKITKKALTEILGSERVKKLIAEAKETFFEDPLIQNDFFIGRNEILTIKFM